jgi:hypothetical protein
MKASLIRLIMGILAFAAIAPASLDAQTSAPPAQAAPLYNSISSWHRSRSIRISSWGKS